MSRLLLPEERETCILMNDKDDFLTIRTHQRTVITKLRKNPAVTITREENFGSQLLVEAEMPKDMITFRTTKRKRPDLTGVPVG